MSFDENIGFLINPGPGDILRFMHGFCELSKAFRLHGTIYCLPAAWRTSLELIRQCSTNSKEGIDAVLMGDIDELRDKLCQFKKNQIVFHAFESDYFHDGNKVFPSLFTNNLSCHLKQMDRFQGRIYMRNRFSDHLGPLPKLECHSNTGLVFIRDSAIVPERNITKTVLSSILDCCNSFHLDFRFAGSSSINHFFGMIANQSSLELYPNEDYPDYYSQICEYSRYAFAIGMNSGALDLAAVSGIPIIRIGEFHHKISHQGIDYNNAISSGFTINLLSNSETDISNITPQSIRYCFELLSKYLYQKERPYRIFLQS